MLVEEGDDQCCVSFAIGIDDVPASVRIAHLKNTHAPSRELDQVESQLSQIRRI